MRRRQVATLVERRVIVVLVEAAALQDGQSGFRHGDCWMRLRCRHAWRICLQGPVTRLRTEHVQYIQDHCGLSIQRAGGGRLRDSYRCPWALLSIGRALSGSGLEECGLRGSWKCAALAHLMMLLLISEHVVLGLRRRVVI